MSPRRIPMSLFLSDESADGSVQIIGTTGAQEVVLFKIDRRLLTFDPFICVEIGFDDRRGPQHEPEVPHNDITA